MKNTRALAMLALSILVGVLAVTMAVRLMNERTRVSTTDVVVASRDIQLGTRLEAEMLKVVRWPSASQPSGVFHSESELLGRVVNSSVITGEPVVEPKLAPPGSTGGLSALIAPGTRALTVKVNEVVGVAGFALPGNYVDVLVHAEDENNHPFSRIVLERILVLAVAQDTNADPSKPKVVNAVTLQVTPEEAEKLDLARGIGQLSLVLRNQVDSEAVMTKGAKVSDLAGGSNLPTAQTVAAAPTQTAAPVQETRAKPAPTHRAAARHAAPRRAVAAKRAPAPAAPAAAPAPAPEVKRPSYIEGVQVSE
ncbi:MAG TPA: Flp pilus assembly protein CpaB [Moraxellaceae bacterium]|nr:Flp pilus assembly protein CpaB [Moraxellaceae bacterium]